MFYTRDSIVLPKGVHGPEAKYGADPLPGAKLQVQRPAMLPALNRPRYELNGVEVIQVHQLVNRYASVV